MVRILEGQQVTQQYCTSKSLRTEKEREKLYLKVKVHVMYRVQSVQYNKICQIKNCTQVHKKKFGTSKKLKKTFSMVMEHCQNLKTKSKLLDGDGALSKLKNKKQPSRW